jgi:putative transposase
VLRAYKYRINPNEEQNVLINKHLGCVRWLYNYALDKKNKTYQEENITLSRFDLQKDLPFLKKQEETSWLKEVNSQSLQYTLDNLDRAFSKFFDDKKKGIIENKKKQYIKNRNSKGLEISLDTLNSIGKPNFKTKKNPKNSFGIPANTFVDFEENKLYIPKFKTGIKIIIDRKFEGLTKSSTISKINNKFYISILVQTNEIIPEKKPISENKAVGIDLGIKSFLVTSGGLVIDNPKYLKESLRRLKIRQRKHSKKKKESNNRKKFVKKILSTHEKISNKRNDFLHKTSKYLIDNYDTLCLETLDVNGMIKNHHLAQSISDVSWAEFNRMLDYKSEWYGKNIIRIGQFEPSSKMCSCCGHIKSDLKLSDREWVCIVCNTKHDRDINAANNIKRIAFEKINTTFGGLKLNTSGTEEIYACGDMTEVTRSA